MLNNEVHVRHVMITDAKPQYLITVCSNILLGAMIALLFGETMVLSFTKKKLDFWGPYNNSG